MNDKITQHLERIKRIERQNKKELDKERKIQEKLSKAQRRIREGKGPKKKDMALKLIKQCQHPSCYEKLSSKVHGKWYCKKHARATRKQRR